MTGSVRVLCVDDNEMVLQALTLRLRRAEGLTVVGTLPQADELPKAAQEKQADVVLLDVDMPGRDAFEAMADLARQRPDIRTIIVTGYIQADLIDRAIANGAWGYLNKADGTDAIIQAIRRVQNGEFAFGPDLRDGHTPGRDSADGRG
jgi:DNA-binding NarL/FixJ family response regulator